MSITPFTPLLSTSPTALHNYPLTSSALRVTFRKCKALPSSRTINSSTRYGLRPRHLQYRLTIVFILMLTSSIWKLWSDVIRNITGLNTFTLSHCGWQTALATASCYLLPPNMCSSVTGCWLDFSCAGLSSLMALALLGTLIINLFFMWLYTNYRHFLK